MASQNQITKYGARWPANSNPLAIEFACIQRGGQWQDASGNTCGAGLFEHYMAARKLIWPHRYRHKWTDLMYKEFINNEFTVLMGSASCQKTSHASEYALLKYWVYPNDTIVLVTTVTMDKLEHAIFAEIKKLFREGIEQFPWLDGHVIDHKHCITTDDIEEEGMVRDLRCGLIGRPCYVGKQYVGTGIFSGIKNTHVVFIADELQFMEPTFLAAADNLFANDDVCVIASGNPQHNPDDQLGIAAEPVEGWSSLPEPNKTTVWPTRLYSGRCINLVGTDSPNFDSPTDIYKGLIGRKFANRIKAAHPEGEHSRQYYTQVKGVMRIDLAKDRVITRDLCYRHHAMDQPIWRGTERTKIYAVDPAYGGGDRCTAIWAEFGEGSTGKQLLYFAGYREIPINLHKNVSAEDQIADGVAEDLARLGIPTQNTFYDSFGKGTVGFAFARKFGSNSPIPIDSGGRTTARPVRQDLLVWDEAKRQKRLKRCDEHYSKFVTEMWFSVRYAIEAEQIRGLPEPIMLEGCMREYLMVAGDKIEVERKEDLRERLGRSPDWFDCASVLCEGARQRGFLIDKLGTDKDLQSEEEDFLAEEARRYQDVLKSKLLVRT